MKTTAEQREKYLKVLEEAERVCQRLGVGDHLAEIDDFRALESAAINLLVSGLDMGNYHQVNSKAFEDLEKLLMESP